MSAYALNLKVTVCWVPGHFGLAGNETANQMAAAAALANTVDITTVPFTDFKPHIRQHLRKMWQADWSQQNTNCT